MHRLFSAIWMSFYEYSNSLIIAINKNSKLPSILRKILLILHAPYIVAKGLICTVLDNTVCRFLTRAKLNKDRSADYEYELGFVAIVKNEGAYIREWIAYHYMACNRKTKFYIYDNESEDGLKEIISDFIDKGIVDYTYYPGYMMQNKAYEDSVRRFGQECRYLAYIDIDEFIQSFEIEPLQTTISAMIGKNRNACGLVLNWAMFGSSGLKEKSDGLVIERFNHRAEDDFWGNEHIKTIANPRMIKKYISCHYPLYKLGGFNVNVNSKRQRLWLNVPTELTKLRLNHYFGKSREEFIAKRSRGRAASGGQYVDFQRFDEYDRNEILDCSMMQYVDGVKCLMNIDSL